MQNTSRHVGEHGNVCPCTCARPVMQMTLQASACDSVSLCGLRHVTLGSPGHSGLAFSAHSGLILWGPALCFAVQSHHHTAHFRDVSCSQWAQKTTKPSKSVPDRSHGVPPQGDRNYFGLSIFLSLTYVCPSCMETSLSPV